VPELGALLENPEVDSETKAGVIRDLLADGDELVRNFLLLVVEKGRASELPEISREFDQLVARAEGRLEVELTTAVELSDDEASDILRQIESASGRRIEATRSVDPDLIGGFILLAGTFRVDASVRGRLDRLRHQLVRR
jgi:F-type H+-transporting ATPase subunit delta